MATVRSRQTKPQDTFLHDAARSGDVDKVRELIERGQYVVNCVNGYGWTPLHYAAMYGHLGVVRMLISEFKADVNGGGTTPYGTPFYLAVHGGVSTEAVALALIKEFDCNTFGGTPYIHDACGQGYLEVVRALVLKHGVDILNHSSYLGNTPLHTAAGWGRKELSLVLINEYHCKTNVKGYKGRSLLHSACVGGDVSLVISLICDHKGDVTARDDDNNTPLHVAAMSGSEDVVFTLVGDFGCDTNVRGHLDRSLLHSAAASVKGSLVEHISRYISPWVVDSNGDTPLHICAHSGQTECVQTLLKLNPPIMIRNNSGKTPRDVASSRVVEYFDAYMRDNIDKIYSHYNAIQAHAKKKYSRAEPITRVFVVGNPGAGKSSLVETLKREGFLDYFWRISEYSVPPHTAGIVPSIHISKHCGRVLFYDFAGDAEYYSSHAAILENLASSRKGDNIFVIVVDLREEMVKIKTIFHYWLSFIQFQQYRGRKPHLIAVGSHLDLLTDDSVVKARGREFQTLCDSTQTEAVSVSAYFMLDCCKPRSKQITDIQNLVSRLTKDSPRFKLSLQASILLGLLEKDFSNVTACSIKKLLVHIEETGIQLPTEVQPLYAILLELHDLGLLFIVDSSNRENLNLVLNMSQLTNIVHKSLFSQEANVRLREIYGSEGLSFCFSAGVIPQSILAKILPENITKECLVQLQYCQEISNTDVRAFPSLTPSESTNQSFLFFPALCSADKSEVAWVTPPDLSYGIGWLARCTDLCDYFPPRFLHVLLLRLVFRFTLSAHPPPNQVWSCSPDHTYFQRRCTMWKTGVHWLMEEGVECMVELRNASKEVVVLTRSDRDEAENCATVINSIISCVMEAKAEFCHSVKLEFFLLDSTDEADCHNADNLFAMRDVERVLTSPEGKEVIVSVSGKGKMKRSKLLCLRRFTHWYSLFPIDFCSVLLYLQDISKELYMLGLLLGMRRGILDALEKEFADTSKQRRELVKGWMSSSLDPPCWWHLIQALRGIQNAKLAEEIKEKYYSQVRLQEKLLDWQNHHVKPDVEFLTSFADVVGSKWSSLAASLSLSGEEIEQVKGEGLTMQDHALKMLRKWVTKEGSTYGQLYQTLKTIPLFQHCQ